MRKNHNQGVSNVNEFFLETKAGKIWGCVFGKDKKGIPLLVVHGGPGFLAVTETV
jgi:hypothetical protein